MPGAFIKCIKNNTRASHNQHCFIPKWRVHREHFKSPDNSLNNQHLGLYSFYSYADTSVILIEFWKQIRRFLV